MSTRSMLCGLDTKISYLRNLWNLRNLHVLLPQSLWNLSSSSSYQRLRGEGRGEREGDQDSIVQNTGLGATGLKKLLKDGSGFEHDFLPVSNVVFQNLKFPDSPLVSFQAKDLIRRLVMKDPKSRLRSEKGAAVIKRHPFFEGLN
ncbi:hypothetical protein HID58_058942 [Brassica napus]|uniref:non-specific serine/threonine protein kinase n=1 Tax=Brassica napus TaxID=3708 RepID=A0ABQ7ZS58_BRANA|nr:hypothetical protein HID58_058942 [Brassica napus]